MKKFRFIAFVVLMSVASSVSAQSDVWLHGYVYSEAEGRQEMIPFATISVYDHDNSENLNAYIVSGIYGEYMLRPYDSRLPHTFVVEAPGYKTRRLSLKEIPEMMGGQPVRGSVSVHFDMERDSSAVFVTEKKEYDKSMIADKDSVKTIKQMLTLIEYLEYDEGLLVEKSTGESVCMMLNGVSMSFVPMSEIEALPLEAVSKIEYYSLPEGGAYGAGVNLVIPTLGYESQLPPVKLQKSQLVF